MSYSKLAGVFLASVLTLVSSLVAVAQPPQIRSVVVQADPVNYAGPCPTTITFTAKIRLSGPGEVRYVWRRSDGTTGPMRTLNFPAPGELEVTETWQLGEPGFSDQVRWESIRVLAPQVRDSTQGLFRLHCQQGGQAQGPQRLPDLTVMINIPRPQDENPRVIVIARNNAQGIAPGTIGTLDPDNGFMIDVVLSSDPEMPAQPAVFSPNFSEDVMIRGGRISRTTDLPFMGAKPYSVNAEIPADTPAGNYFLCARIDPLNKVAESVEANNVACKPFNVARRQ